VIDRGRLVNAYLETSARDVYAAGDIARWPDPHCRRLDQSRVLGGPPKRQGQTVAGNMLGLSERFDAVPLFWSQHYDVPIN
jgi:NADPH-dependent 2,4-dienoyl-CoA reductase/sulfur reductase-like enzyme